MRSVLQQTVSGKAAERVALHNFATDDASPHAVPVEKPASARPGSVAQPPYRADGGSRCRFRTCVFMEYFEVLVLYTRENLLCK